MTGRGTTTHKHVVVNMLPEDFCWRCRKPADAWCSITGFACATCFVAAHEEKGVPLCREP